MALGLGFASRTEWLGRLTALEYQELKVLARYEFFGLDRSDSYAMATSTCDRSAFRYEPETIDEMEEDAMMSVMSSIDASGFDG